jgi:predicted O-methyltransferase YrrM
MSRPRPLAKKAAHMLRLMDRAVTAWTIPVIGVEKGRVLRRLLARHAPTRGIEVGSLFGYSAILIAGSMPRGGRLTCVEENAYLAKFAEYNTAEAGLKGRVRVVVGDALRVLPMLRGSVDFLLLDAKKDDYLDYLRAVEPRLVKGALVVADNTGVFRRDVKPYLDYVREGGRYQSREHDFGFDCMEVSVLRA